MAFSRALRWASSALLLCCIHGCDSSNGEFRGHDVADFGLVAPGELVYRTVQLRNSQARPRKMMRIESPCTCVSAVGPTDAVLAGGVYEVRLELKLPGSIPLEHASRSHRLLLIFQDGETEHLDVVYRAKLAPIITPAGVAVDADPSTGHFMARGRVILPLELKGACVEVSSVPGISIEVGPESELGSEGKNCSERILLMEGVLPSALPFKKFSVEVRVAGHPGALLLQLQAQRPETMSVNPKTLVLLHGVTKEAIVLLQGNQQKVECSVTPLGACSARIEGGGDHLRVFDVAADIKFFTIEIHEASLGQQRIASIPVYVTADAL